MLTLGFTGGIATGKSTLVRFMADALQAPIFDADASAKSFLEQDPSVRQEVDAAFGPDAYHQDGTPNRPLLRHRIFSSPSHRIALEQILHPRVREQWTTQHRHLSDSRTCNFYLVEIPLLYETGADQVVDRVIVTGCRTETQVRRLVELRKLPEPMARSILASQLDPAEKMRRCDHVAWNESSPAHLLEQARILASHFLHA